MKIHLAADHAGFSHKEFLKKYLIESGYDVVDHGAKFYDEHDDYPSFIHDRAKAVSEDVYSKGVIFGGSGQGEAIVANKTKGIRAVVYYGGEQKIITLSREHNDANILSIGARFIEEESLIPLVMLWLQTPFSEEERHIKRIASIHSYE